jgi:hypothetical protein
MKVHQEDCECSSCMADLQDSIEHLTRIVNRWRARVERHEAMAAEAHATFTRRR